MRRAQLPILALASAATALHAQTMSLQSDERYIETLAQYQTQDDQFGFDARTREPATPFEGWADSTGVDITRADASASMSSILSDTSMLATGSANANAIFDANSSVFTIAFATARHIVAFDLAQTTSFALIADLVATTNAESFITVRQDTRFGSLLHEYSVSDGALSINDQITLDAGTYYLEFRAESDHEHHSPADTTGAASFDAAWSVVPTPATTVVLLLAAGAATPRRRAA